MPGFLATSNWQGSDRATANRRESGGCGIGQAQTRKTPREAGHSGTKRNPLVDKVEVLPLAELLNAE
jgi:hypothetical protein